LRVEQFERGIEPVPGFHVSRPRHGLLCRQTEILHSLRRIGAPPVMVGEVAILIGEICGEQRLDGLPRPLVYLSAVLSQQ
jgi:hypothetical protein